MHSVLSDTFGDCILGDLDGGFPSGEDAYSDGYEYDSDSDLDSDSESEDEEGPKHAPHAKIGLEDADDGRIQKLEQGTTKLTIEPETVRASEVSTFKHLIVIFIHATCSLCVSSGYRPLPCFAKQIRRPASSFDSWKDCGTTRYRVPHVRSVQP